MHGNIINKTGIGGYSYNSSKINRLDSISVDTSYNQVSDHSILYNSENLTLAITQDPYHIQLLYGPSGNRIKTVLTENGDTIKKKYFSLGYEKEITGSGTRQLHYIYSPYGLIGVMIKQGETENFYFTETDQVGSIISLLNSDGSYAEKYLYDAWGRRRNPDTWNYDSIPKPALIERGFTGHEHLDEFGLINMLSSPNLIKVERIDAKSREFNEAGNGRMYDPYIGRFLSVDPFIQFPGNSQSFNGYSYCLNNPLKYIDPTGYLEADPWSAYVRATARGYTGGYGSFSDQYYDQYYDYMFTGGGGGFSGSGGDGSTSMTFTWHTWKDSNEVVGEEVHITSEKVNHSVTIQTLFADFGRNSYNNASATGGTHSNIDYTSGPYTSWIGVLGQVAEYSNKEISSLAVKTVGKYATRIGWGGEIVSNAVNVVNISRNPTWGNYGRLAVSLGTTATNLIPYAGPGISFGLSAWDAEGHFNNFYDILDQDQSFYNSTGYVIVPGMTGGVSILKLKK